MKEDLEEQASLYVLGLLEDAEATQFEERLESDPGLRRLVDGLDETTAQWAHRAPPRPLPPELRKRVVAESAVSQGAVFSRRAVWVPWILAASFALTTSYLVAERSGLRHRIQHLQERDLFAQIQIASLTSKSGRPPIATGAIVWDERKQRGILKVTELPPNDDDHDYQLWLLDPRYKNPVNGGVFHVANQAPLRISFRPATPVRNAAGFALRLERKGGVPAPAGPVILAGK